MEKKVWKPVRYKKNLQCTWKKDMQRTGNLSLVSGINVRILLKMNYHLKLGNSTKKRSML